MASGCLWIYLEAPLMMAEGRELFLSFLFCFFLDRHYSACTVCSSVPTETHSANDRIMLDLVLQGQQRSAVISIKQTHLHT